MTTDTSTTDSSTDTGSSAVGGAKARAQETASSAASEGQHVAGVAKGEAQHVVAEAADQVRGLADQARTQVASQLDDQTRQGKDRLTGTLSSFGDDLGDMAENGSGLAAQVAQEVAGRARALSQHLESRDPSELVDDVRRFARQRPGTFLLGSLAAGVVVGRLLRGTKDSVEAAGSGGGSDSGSGTHAATSGTGGVGSGTGSESYTDPTLMAPQVTPGAPNTVDVPATHGQRTQPESAAFGEPPTLTMGGDTPPTATGYSSPPTGSGVGGGVGGELDEEGPLP